MAAKHASVKPIWSSEIEKFPCAVTAHHFPDVKQLGDITKIDGAEIDPADIICAGSPCQDLSIAGKQEGLKGERSGLFLRAIDIVRCMRMATNGKYPRFFVWENVPGAFSSNRGLDFRTVLEEISQTEIPMPKDNRWANAGVVEWGEGSLAWRVLDAQYWGVPQRRKRIFLVCDFGGQSAGEILFEREGVQRHTSAGREAREGATAGTESGAYIPSKARSLTARADGSPCIDRGPQIIVAGFKHKASGTAGSIGYQNEQATTLMEGQQSAVAIFDMTHANNPVQSYNSGVCHTLNARMGTGGNQVPVVHAYSIAGNTIDRKPQNGGNGAGWQKDVSYTLNTMDRHVVATFAESSFGMYKKSDVAGVQKAKGGTLGGGSESLVCGGTVRRLTPLEAERLQGLPENYTLIDDKSCSDTARYKALGNGMAQPCADWVIQRIEKMALGVAKEL